VETLERKRPKAGGALSLSQGLAWVKERPEVVLLVCVVIAMAFNLWETRGQTFFSDEWSRFLYADKSVGGLLRGHTGHLVLLNTILYKALLVTFGAHSYAPYRIAEALLLGTCGVLFYALARNWADPWLCLAATVILLFLGSSVEVVATPTGTVNLMPIAFGLAALLCLQLRPKRGDLFACLLLIAAVASHSDGLAFLVGAAVMLVLQSGRRALGRSWVVWVPAAVYLTWLAWYRVAETSTTQQVVHAHNFGSIPSTIVAAAATGLSAISGLFGSAESTSFNLDAGYMVLGLLVVFVAWWVLSGRPLRREFWVALALGLAFWALLGTVVTAERPATASRYIYPSAIFLLLIILALVGRPRMTPRIAWVTAGVLLVALVPNVIALNDEARKVRDLATVERAQLGAVELLRDEVPPASIPDLVRGARIIRVGGPGFRFPPITYFNAVLRYGSPAASPQALASGGEAQRHAVDEVLLKGDDLTLSNTPGRPAAAGNCVSAIGSGGGGREFAVSDTGLVILPHGSRSELRVAARRFGASFQLLSIPNGSGPLVLTPGASQAVRPWVARISGARVCRPG
jgi:hypothetical protein